MENYKEKYEQALERAKKLQANAKGLILNKWLYNVFPELKESKNYGEKIKKVLISRFNKSGELDGIPYDDIRIWLEKQGKVKHTCRNCKTFQDLHQNCPYSPIYQYTDLTDAHKHLDDETHCEFWLEKQGEQKHKVTEDLPNGEDYGIDSLWHAIQILERTLGEVEGYQSDDGILEHKCAIEAVNRLYKQKPAKWSEEDENVLDRLIKHFDWESDYRFDKNDCDEAQDWLKSLKERYTWKPSDEQMEALEKVRVILHNPSIWDESNPILYQYEELMRDLIKLREE